MSEPTEQIATYPLLATVEVMSVQDAWFVVGWLEGMHPAVLAEALIALQERVWPERRG